ncbi:hypothetical protein GUITHDRAFT_155504 [Guillardia theta CCMP2712]|uniref:Uncharacterized protein n=2 Tax=Guillardia theta TaxID=55529 RepID=L1IGL9_GUITC|nr:hypothetical protein GUITHDRAFT_155504 [Guillardia theta CCMP2712]EKX35401.1 hypothetical protein GUITHDRAFT_155504 [Guillardia theta CCMP2712]|mmetsp:Transcript_52087/g.161939  ORF Transcript_52087/g.161939 Transcript_52087/m.161939 type:complete len:117 (+) Transcript_52087:136-486(+)|eukprot:XP_005822381.1 hypothetical protein GUITHDRAFT_155504 [Guillardia theta CCMP2712]
MSKANTNQTTNIGAGNETEYWDFVHRKVERTDLGHRCRECKQPFDRLGDPLTERRGARVSLRYHTSCFSGYKDPRSQSLSSAYVGTLSGTQSSQAPTSRTHKMRTDSHFSLPAPKK